MMSSTKEFKLYDNDAAELFNQLQGLDDSDRAIQSSDIPEKEKDSFTQEDERLDNWKLFLIDTIHLIAAYFIDVHFLQGIKAVKKDTFSELAETLGKLIRMPGNDGSILLRFRGFPTGTNIPAKADYATFFGNMVIDASSAATMFSRMGIRMTHLSGRLLKAFELFSSHGISNLYLNIQRTESNTIDAETLERLRISLNILSRYNHALKTNIPITFEIKGKQVSVPIIKDENGQPDPNLTLTAGLNNMEPAEIMNIIGKVSEWMRNVGSKVPGEQNISVYNAIFRIKNLKEKLIKPPIEVNNIKWLMVDKSGWEVISKEKADTARLITEKFTNSPNVAARIMHSIYGKDYEEIDSDNFGDRIQLTSALLNTIGNEENNKESLKEILKNVQQRVDELRDEVFDDLIVQKDEITVRSNKQEKVIKNVHKKLINIIGFYKGRSVTKKKIRNIGREKIDFDDQDYNLLAKDFNMPVEDVKVLLDLLKSCFDNHGHFLRKVFEQNIPEFAKYEKKVFEFIWHYLKRTPHRNDRVAFLNSLQLLIARMKQRKRAIQILLADFLKNPETVNFPERNAFILANLLVRKYNKEMNVDIEITPEEVLMVRNGLDKETADDAADMIDKYQEKFLQKIKAIHREMMDSLNKGKADTKAMPLNFLMRLEREIYIFCSLVGGSTARYVLRTAMKKYGNLNSEVYKSQDIRQNMPLILQHLKILVRAVGRMRQIEDLSFLSSIIELEPEFMKLCEGTQCRDKMRHVMKWTDTAMKDIIQNVD